MRSVVTVLSLLIYFILIHQIASLANKNGVNCSTNDCNMIWRIGAIIDSTSRVGKEQKLAMEMAVDDFNDHSQCSELVFNFVYSHGTSASAASLATYLVNKKQVHAILGPLTQQEAALVSDFDEVSKDIPIISVSPTATYLPLLLNEPPSLIQMSNNVTSQMQCIAAIVGHFKWRKVIALYESSNSFSSTDSGLITHLSDSLHVVDSTVEYHLAFPPLSSISRTFIREELKKLNSKNVRVFVVVQCSLQFGLVFFELAMQMGMVGKGYVWIVSEKMASLLDSVEPSLLLNMQGVIGFKVNVPNNSDSFREFSVRFRKKYRSNYPEEEGNSYPSLYALRAYDAIWATAKAMQKLSKAKCSSSSKLVESILLSDFEGLSGKVSFKNGMLIQKPVFRIINVIGKSYKEVSFWSPEFGFSEDLIEHNGANLKIGFGGALESILWPGGMQTVPKGWTIGGLEKPLKIGVPARGVFNQFVKVNLDQEGNETLIGGFSVEVFKAVVKQLPYYLPYVLVPFYGNYDEMVIGVANKSLDAAVGDTEILANRYEYAEFSQPYIDSGLVVIVTAKSKFNKPQFIVMKAFKWKLWILLAVMSMSTGVVIWLNEYVNGNPDFNDSFPQLIGSMLWFSVTVLSFSQRESIRSNLSRLVLTTWLCIVVVVTACFTAVLSSMMTVPRLESVDYLLNSNAAVGCNNNSFISQYLVNSLNFNPKNIKTMSSVTDYHIAFKNGDISAAFFVAPHAKVFLAKYCKGYTKLGSVYKLGGFGFVFPKGSPLAVDISEAVLRISQSGEIHQLEEQMLLSPNCASSSTDQDQDPSLGPELFSGPLLISGALCGIVLVISIARLVRRNWITLSHILASNATIFFRCASLLLTQCYTRLGFRLFKDPSTRIEPRTNDQQNGGIIEVL